MTDTNSPRRLLRRVLGTATFLLLAIYGSWRYGLDAFSFGWMVGILNVVLVLWANGVTLSELEEITD